MSEENVENVRRAYATLNDAYKSGSGDVNDFLPIVEELCDPGVVLWGAGTRFPEAGEWHGPKGMLEFIAAQMEGFTQMWIEPQKFIDAGDKLVVLVRFGGQARHTSIEVEFEVGHVWTFRDGKVVRVDMHGDKSDALEAAWVRK